MWNWVQLCRPLSPLRPSDTTYYYIVLRCFDYLKRVKCLDKAPSWPSSKSAHRAENRTRRSGFAFDGFVTVAAAAILSDFLLWPPTCMLLLRELLLTSTSKIPFSIYKPFGLATLFTSGQITCNLFCSLAQAAKERLDGKPVLGTIIDVAFQQHAVAFFKLSLISMNNGRGAWRRPLWSTQYKWPGQHQLSKSGKCLVHLDRCTCQQSVNIWALNEDSPWKEARTKEGQAVEETTQRETERNGSHCSHFGGLLLPCCHAANNVGETTTWVSLRPPGVEFHRVACQIPVSLH